MSSIHRLTPEHREALRKGRAIPFILDHRIPELPDHTLTVIGLLDGEAFYGLLLPDNQPDEPIVDIVLPCPLLVIDDSVRLESADVAAVHRLWQRWNGGVREAYLGLARQISIGMAIDVLENFLSAQERAPSRSRSRRKTKKTPARKGGKTS